MSSRKRQKLSDLNNDPIGDINKQPLDVSIIDSGEVILTFNDGGRARVLSHVLCDASPVFKAMLGPNFKEGQDARTAANPKEIPLPGDDGPAMISLCGMIHPCKVMSFGGELTPSKMLDIAVVAEKYDCIDSVSVAAEAFLSRYVSKDFTTLAAHTVGDLLASAMLLEQTYHFALFSRYLILNRKEPLSALFSSAAAQVVSVTCILNLEQLRRTAESQLSNKIDDITRNICGKCKMPLDKLNAEIGREIASRLEPTLSQWPASYDRTHTLRDALTAAMRGADMEFHWECEPCQRNKPARFNQEALTQTCREVDELVTGLCLDCVNEGKSHTECPHEAELKALVSHDKLR